MRFLQSKGAHVVSTKCQFTRVEEVQVDLQFTGKQCLCPWISGGENESEPTNPSIFGMWKESEHQDKTHAVMGELVNSTQTES